MPASSKEKIRKIYEVLPKLNCGLCGFGSCGQFARAAAEGRASPFGCRQSPWAGYRISEIIGVRVPVYGYGFQPAPASSLIAGPSSKSLKALKEEVRGLSEGVGSILKRIENLRARRQGAVQN